MKIEAGKYYKLRDGRRVFVCAIDKPGELPVLGWLDDGRTLGFTKEGWFYLDGSNSKYDIVSEWEEEIYVPWDKLFPPWVKWFAIDWDGEQCGFSSKPKDRGMSWGKTPQDSGIVYLPHALRIPYYGDWRKSLIERKDEKE